MNNTTVSPAMTQDAKSAHRWKGKGALREIQWGGVEREEDACDSYWYTCAAGSLSTREGAQAPPKRHSPKPRSSLTDTFPPAKPFNCRRSKLSFSSRKVLYIRATLP